MAVKLRAADGYGHSDDEREPVGERRDGESIGADRRGDGHRCEVGVCRQLRDRGVAHLRDGQDAVGDDDLLRRKGQRALVAWALVGVHLGISLRFKIKILGIYAAPLAVFILLLATQFPKEPVQPLNLLKGIWLTTHIITVFAGDAALALAAGAGMLYLIQEHAIKSKTRGFFFKRLPSLELLDNTGHACIVVGFTLLTIGLITGMIYAKIKWAVFWSWDTKEIWSAVTWLFYAVLLHERLAVGWRGRRAAIMAIAGFAVMLFTFFGVNLLLSGHHGQFMQWQSHYHG